MLSVPLIDNFCKLKNRFDMIGGLNGEFLESEQRLSPKLCKPPNGCKVSAKC